MAAKKWNAFLKKDFAEMLIPFYDIMKMTKYFLKFVTEKGYNSTPLLCRCWGNGIARLLMWRASWAGQAAQFKENFNKLL